MSSSLTNERTFISLGERAVAHISMNLLCKLLVDCLKSLCIEWLQFKDIVRLHCSVTDKKFRAILEKNLYRCELLCGDCIHLTSEVLHWIVERQLFLKSIEFDACATNEEISYFGACVCRARYISLAGCVHVNDQTLLALLTRVEQLISLNLAECSSVTEESILTVVAKPNKLEVLNANGCYILTNRVIRAIAENCQNLRELHCAYNFSVNDEDIASVVKGCPRLEVIDLSVCSDVTDEGVLILAEHCPSLQHLNLTNCSNVTDRSLVELAAKCPRLHTLIMGFCNKLSDKTLVALAHNLSEIRVLNFNGCRRLTDAGVITLVSRCRQLTHLDLPYCVAFTDASVHAIAEHCPQLKHLNVSNCENVTDDGVICLARACADLYSLKLSYCTLTDAAVQAIAEYCPHLQWLDISGCGQTTQPPAGGPDDAQPPAGAPQRVLQLPPQRGRPAHAAQEVHTPHQSRAFQHHHAAGIHSAWAAAGWRAGTDQQLLGDRECLALVLFQL